MLAGYRVASASAIEISYAPGSGNVFADLGYSPAEAAALTAKTILIIAMKDAVGQRKLTQLAAARLSGTNQAMLSKLLRGRMESVTIDRLASWPNAQGQRVEMAAPGRRFP